MEKWKECTISDIGTVVGGSTPSTKVSENYHNGTIAWITPKDLSISHERYIEQGEKNITELGLKSCSTTLLPQNTVLFSSRAPIGYIAIAKNEVCTNQGFKNIIPNKNITPLFLYYLLKYNKDRIENMGSGTTFKEVSASVMNSIVIRIPEKIQIQQKIAKLLGSLDDKIELNRRINTNLEQQAQAIFKEMFIDNGLKNVKKGMLQDIAEITMGLSPDGSSYNEKQLGIIFFQGRAEFSDRFPKIRLYTSQPKRMAMRNDILMSVRAPVGDINIAHHDCCIGRGLASLRSKYNYQSFLFYTMLNLKKYLDRFNSEGTVFGAISKDALNTIPIDIPSEGKIKHFEQIASPIDTCILNNYKEICCLESLRDTLLPKLMSGEIDVSKIELD